ncbi:hypothetical protein [Lysobacter gummosus]|uniref:hypothetical protein n=1 Tax=Lysobacter gummosus TaxID=262324 RepID=UPI0036448BA9
MIPILHAVPVYLRPGGPWTSYAGPLRAAARKAAALSGIIRALIASLFLSGASCAYWSATTTASTRPASVSSPRGCARPVTKCWWSLPIAIVPGRAIR